VRICVRAFLLVDLFSGAGRLHLEADVDLMGPLTKNCGYFKILVMIIPKTTYDRVRRGHTRKP
tara:strand:+ start:9379 stop:9567 length:189 start_codon:yes stop_codon:yes gene_type:complete